MGPQIVAYLNGIACTFKSNVHHTLQVWIQPRITAKSLTVRCRVTSSHQTRTTTRSWTIVVTTGTFQLTVMLQSMGVLWDGIIVTRYTALCRRQVVTYDVLKHYSNVIMRTMAPQITGVSIVYSTVCLAAEKQQRSASLACVGDFPEQRASNAEMFPINDVIMND